MSSFRKKNVLKPKLKLELKPHRQGKTLGGLQIYTAVLLFFILHFSFYSPPQLNFCLRAL